MSIYNDFFIAKEIDFKLLLNEFYRYINSAFFSQSHNWKRKFFIPNNETYTHTFIPFEDKSIQHMYNGIPIRDWDSITPMNINIYDSNTIIPEDTPDTSFQYSFVGNGILVKHTDSATTIEVSCKIIEKVDDSIDSNIYRELERLYYNLYNNSNSVYLNLRSLSETKQNVLSMNTKVKPIVRVRSIKNNGISLRV